MTDLDDGRLRLRAGLSIWSARNGGPNTPCRQPLAGEVITADVAIIGGGITGAFAAERLTRDGRAVVVIDRHAPTTGSTMASTAMLQWELDSSLVELEDRLGVEGALRVSAQCRNAVASIIGLVSTLSVQCDLQPRSSIFLTGNKHDVSDLREEARLRSISGAPCDSLNAAGLERLGVVGDAGLVSPGSAIADPVRLARGLLSAAVARGAVILSPTVATEFEEDAHGVEVRTSAGAVVRASAMVLANGYEMPEFVHAPSHKITSSWALATTPQGPQKQPADEFLVWEAADPYLYFRAGPGGCVIVGGEDQDVDSADARDALTPAKTAAILAKLAERRPDLRHCEAEFAWSGFFGETADSMPLIGRVGGRERCFAAFGYGGNGITFSAIAADMIALELAGQRHPNADFYALDRAA